MSWKKQIGSRLKELRFVFCQDSVASLGARNFVLDNYLQVKENNPRFPFIVRECAGAEPLLIARYRKHSLTIGYGIEKKEVLSNFSKEQIEDIVNELVEQSDEINKQLHS